MTGGWRSIHVGGRRGRLPAALASKDEKPWFGVEGSDPGLSSLATVHIFGPTLDDATQVVKFLCHFLFLLLSHCQGTGVSCAPTSCDMICELLCQTLV